MVSSVTKSTCKVVTLGAVCEIGPPVAYMWRSIKNIINNPILQNLSTLSSPEYDTAVQPA